MGHKHETQTHSNDVPNTLRRNGTYYYRRRIPSDLVAVEAFGKTQAGKPVEFLKYSLKTKNPREARRRVAIEDFKAEELFEAKRQELKLTFAANSKLGEGVKRMPLALLSDVERRDLVFRHFIHLERKSRDYFKGYWELGAAERQEVLMTANTDYDHLCGLAGHEHPQVNWDAELKRLLERMEVDAGEAQGEAFKMLRELLQRAEVENVWRFRQALLGEPQSEHDPAFRGIGSETPLPAIAKRQSKTITELFRSIHETKNKKGVSEASHYKNRERERLLVDYFGAERSIATITMEEAQHFADFLGTIPKRANDRYKGLSLQESAKREARKPAPSLIAPKTQRLHLLAVSGAFNFAVTMGWIPTNPFSSEVVSCRLPKVEKKEKSMMTPANMVAVFTSPEFVSERDKGDRGNARFWIPLLCLFHGCRSNEAAQLLVSDVKQEEGIDFLHIIELDDSGHPVKQLKTSASRRKVPLHQEIVKIGFLRYVDEMRARGERELFPSLKANKRGSKVTAVGQWFGRLRLKILNTTEGKDMHSLRHSFAHACREIDMDARRIRALGGWMQEGRSSEKDYGSEYSLESLKKAIDQVEFVGADFSQLY